MNLFECICKTEIYNAMKNKNKKSAMNKIKIYNTLKHIYKRMVYTKWGCGQFLSHINFIGVCTHGYNST